jgi:ketosteroid isomerase-like protein
VTEEEIRELATEGMRLHSAAHRDEFLALMAPDVTWVLPEAELHGPQEVAAFVAPFDEAVPDGCHRADRVYVDGNTAIVESTFVGTHTGTLRTPMGDVSPSGNRVAVRSVVLIEPDDAGQCKSARIYYDRLDMLAQLGALPESAPA